MELIILYITVPTSRSYESWSVREEPYFSWYHRDVFAKAHGLIRLILPKDFSSLKPYKATGFINLAFDLDNPFGL